MRTTKRVITQVTKQADDQQDLVAALRGLGVSDARIKLFRYANYPARPEYIDDVEIEIVTTGSLEQFLKEKYGAGSYLARGFANGQWVKDGSRVVHIFGEKKEDHSKNGAGDQGDMWKFLMSQQQASSDRFLQMMQQSNSTMVQMFTAIIAGMKPMDLQGIAAMMGAMKPAGTMKETLETVTTIVDLTNKMSGGAEPADPMTMMLGAGLDLIRGRALAAPQPAAAAPAANPQPATPAGPANSQPAAAATAPAPGTTEQQVMNERLVFLEKLKQKARAGKDPSLWADYIEDNQDEAVCSWLLSTVRQHPWDLIFQGLTQMDRELAQEPYAAWFHELYDLLTNPEASDESGKNNP